jgi:uncharacterized protein YozE (UPF0346 family)
MPGLFGVDGFRMNKNKPRDSTRLTQHFFFFTKRKPVLKEKKTCFFIFFFTKRKPVLKEKKTCFFSQAFFLRKVVSQGFYRR